MMDQPIEEELIKIDARLAQLDDDRIGTLARQQGWRNRGAMHLVEREGERLVNLERERTHLLAGRYTWECARQNGVLPIAIQR